MFRLQPLFIRLTFFICFLAIFLSCSKDGDDSESNSATLLLSPESVELDFGNSRYVSFAVQNSNGNNFDWSVSTKPDWLIITPSSGIISDDIIPLELRIDGNSEDYDPGTTTGTISITSENLGSISTEISFFVETLTSLEVSHGRIEFDYFENNDEISLVNSGNTDLNWSLDNTYDFITFSPSAGNLKKGESVSVAVDLDRQNLISGDYEYNIAVLGGTEDHDLDIAVKNYKEEKWLLGEILVDAIYDRNSDRIIAVTTDSDKLLIIDPFLKTVKEVGLNLAAKAISVSQDGNFAVVGHNGKISYVDLQAEQLLKVLNVSADVFDLVLAPNGFVYVMPEEDQWERIRCVNVDTEEETLHSGNSVYEKTRIDLHPSGNYIYGADTQSSPSDFEKYDITAGTAQYLYDSRYHGDFAFSGGVWISDDGNLLFARSGNVFASSESQNDDILYRGKLEDTDFVFHLDIHNDSNLVAVLQGTSIFGWDENPTNIITLHTADFLTTVEQFSLPGYLKPDGVGGGELFDSQGYFVYVNSAGTKLITLQKPSAEYGTEEWSLYVRDLE